MRKPSAQEYLLARIVESGELVGVIGRVAFSYFKTMGLQNIVPLSLSSAASAKIGHDSIPGMWLESRHDPNSGVGFLVNQEDVDDVSKRLMLDGYAIHACEFAPSLFALLEKMWDGVLGAEYQEHQVREEEDADEKRDEMHRIIAELVAAGSHWVIARIRNDHQLFRQ